MYQHTRLAPFILGLALAPTLATAPAYAAQQARPGYQISQPSIVPFSGTATFTFTASDPQVPAKAAKDLLQSEQTSTFAVRDATHWRVNVHVAAPLIDSNDQTIAADGQQVVEYSTLFNRAFRLPGGVTQSAALLSVLLRSAGAPLGTTAAQYAALLKRNSRVKVRSLGQAQVAGRLADVLRISPLGSTTTGPCTGPKSCAQKEKGYGWAKVWLDHQYGIVLRYEQHGVPKNMGIPRGYRYVVTSITFGSTPSDSALAYTPPVPMEDYPSSSGAQSSGSASAGPGARFQAPPGFIAVGSPGTHQSSMSLQGWDDGEEFLSDGISYVQGVFRDSANQGFVYLKERIRALGLPAGLTTESPQTAGACQVWTGTFPDGVRWLAMMRGHIAILVVTDTLTQANLVQYAASGICTAPIVPPPSAQQVEDTALDHLETEIDITRQILGWVTAAAPTAADQKTLKTFDQRLEAFDRTVFAIRHRHDPQAVYSPPGFPPAQKGTFADTVAALKGEMGAAKDNLSAAEAAVQSPADRQTLEQQGTVFDDLIRAVDAML